MASTEGDELPIIEGLHAESGQDMYPLYKRPYPVPL
jgi:hypothetical protein